MFQLILPFQLDLPFDASGSTTESLARSGGNSARTGRSKAGSRAEPRASARARRERTGSASLELPCFRLGAVSAEQALETDV